MEQKKRRRRQSKKQKRRRVKVYISRIIVLLAAIAVLCLIVFGIIKLFSFIGSRISDSTKDAGKENVNNIISIAKDGSLTETSVEDFDTNEYDAEALEKMVNDTIADYNGSGDEKITLKNLDIKNGKARAVIRYDSAEDYASYNSKTFVIGDASDLDITGVTLADDKNAVLTHDDMENIKGKYVLLNDDTRVTVPGGIQFVSRNVKKTGKKTADVKKAGIDSVIIYK